MEPAVSGPAVEGAGPGGAGGGGSVLVVVGSTSDGAVGAGPADVVGVGALDGGRGGSGVHPASSRTLGASSPATHRRAARRGHGLTRGTRSAGSPGPGSTGRPRRSGPCAATSSGA